MSRSVTSDLVIGGLTLDEVDDIAWSGSASHLQSIRRKLTTRGIDYLTVRRSSGEIVAKGMIDYNERSDGGLIEQLATHPDVQGQGIGSFLIAEMERRIGDAGRPYAMLGVEDDNPRARALYERLGYEVFDRVHDSWESTRDDGTTYMYETEVTLLRKRL